jgi:hypothetical protein
MSRRPASITQADVARIIRAAKQAGAPAVEITPGGTIRIVLAASSLQDEGSSSLDRELEEFEAHHGQG